MGAPKTVYHTTVFRNLTDSEDYAFVKHRYTADNYVLSGNYVDGYLYLHRETNYENNPPTETYVAYSDAAHTSYAQQGYYSFGDFAFGVIRQIEVAGNGVIVYDYVY